MRYVSLYTENPHLTDRCAHLLSRRFFSRGKRAIRRQNQLAVNQFADPSTRGLHANFVFKTQTSSDYLYLIQIVRQARQQRRPCRSFRRTSGSNARRGWTPSRRDSSRPASERWIVSKLGAASPTWRRASASASAHHLASASRRRRDVTTTWATPSERSVVGWRRLATESSVRFSRLRFPTTRFCPTERGNRVARFFYEKSPTTCETWPKFVSPNVPRRQQIMHKLFQNVPTVARADFWPPSSLKSSPICNR